jgi:hypothetical protein
VYLFLGRPRRSPVRRVFLHRAPWNGPAYARFSRFKVSARSRFTKSLANGSFNGLFGAPCSVVVAVSNRVSDEGFSRFFHHIFLHRNDFMNDTNCTRSSCHTARVRRRSNKFSRAKPHMNIGTIGHVDHGKVTPVFPYPRLPNPQLLRRA